MRYEIATWDPITRRDTARLTPRRLVIHTAVSSSQDLYGPQRGSGGTYAHFYVTATGKLRQHQDTAFIAQATLDGNATSIAVETWDGGDPEHHPFTDSQLETLAQLFAHLVRYEHVPNRIATPEDTSGLAWHRLGCRGNFGAFNRADPLTWTGSQTGERWTKAFGKTCPGDARIKQIPQIYARAQKYLTTQRKDTTLMALSDAQQKQLLEKTLKTNDAAGRIDKIVPQLVTAVNQLTKEVAELKKRLA